MEGPRRGHDLIHILSAFMIAASSSFAAEAESIPARQSSARVAPPAEKLDFSSITHHKTAIAFNPIYLPAGFEVVDLDRKGKSQAEVVKVRAPNGPPYALRVVALKNPGRPSLWRYKRDLELYLAQVKREQEILRRFGGNHGIIALEGSYYAPDRDYLYLLTGSHDFYFNDIMYRYNLSENQIKYLAQQLLTSLAFLHMQGIAHGGFSPSSIGINRDCKTFIRDFGLETAHLGVGDYTFDFNLEAFKAPEQLLRPESLEPKPEADLWSLGLILARTILGPGFLDPEHGDVPHYLQTLIHNFGSAEARNYATELEQVEAQRFLHNMIDKVKADNPAPPPPLATLLAEKGISEKGIAFICSLLTFDPRKRPSAHDALAHSWFSK